MGLGGVPGLHQLLNHSLLLIGEVDPGTRQCRHLANRVIEGLAQHGSGTAKIHLKGSRHVERHLLGALEVIPGDVGKGQKPGRYVIEDGLVTEDGLALELRRIGLKLVEIVPDLIPGRLESSGNLRLCFGLRIRILEGDHPQRSERSRHLQRQRLADGREPLLQLAEALFHLVCFLLELVRVRTNLYEQICYPS